MIYKPLTPLPPGPLSGQRILVVDDAEDDRTLLSGFLLRHGVRLYIGTDGQDGYRKAQTVRPDLILMDIRMPGYDGLTSCRLLKANTSTRNIPVIFLSAATTTEEKVTGLSTGAVDYITKPFDFEEVRLRLCIHLRSAARSNAPSASTESVEIPHGTNTFDMVLFQAARKLMLEKLDQTLSLNGLASAVGTNARRLSSAFKNCAGVTVFDFLREERMREARRLLSETTLEIGAIALALGYSNTANFSTAFRERFGMPPSQFRR
ncbi:response regulator [Herbaspirillum seropedicae]|jgi:DNA-binding response OmpR family regulator|uniref:AraC family two-component hybrid sensor/regulator transcription regulator protein n=1 Tax=Herbaspirillum seropedicae (strain SmR1) TaxID=757424 RepID=D8IP62_HERSS|nr:response regulator [Herbaspirillum seropedicae]ADJ62882.1 AraC family two-component hybrid sensor/regulator transcription regulator protein [Herbaspirillum seropedicae SmR1]AKN64971.1 AraC family transcriptional regulator [Herbaspirillum seropedicae]AON53602.1 AraC family transcriptional regulator [Herbaspirillum seropedicae]MDR6396696.1 DNA-binding response OmpR family regulator [Herbaspirillum seropedicae]NQE31229.1 AraC family transcriptional regulator [Herbaspirillum seropedicae]